MVYFNRFKEDTKALRDTTLTRTLAKKRLFEGNKVSPEIIINCFDFAYTMSKNSLHRSNRSGGTHVRSELELFWDTFRGKIAECVVYDYFSSKHYEVSDVDFQIYPRGVWDSFDMCINGRFISIKSTKHFGQLLLLEEADWDKQGKYLPDKNGIEYSNFLLVRTKIDYSNQFNAGYLPEYDSLKNYCLGIDIEGEITGILSHENFVNQIIRYSYLIKQGQLLQGKVPMDATNYYVHAYDLESADTI